MEDYKIIDIDPITRKATVKPPYPPQKIAGLDKLIQTVILAILNDPGRNAQYPSQGSGLPSLIGQSNIDPSDPTEAFAEVSERIEKIRDEILENQNALEDEASSERLKDLVVLSIDSGVNIDEIVLELQLVSEAGSTTSIVI